MDQENLTSVEENVNASTIENKPTGVSRSELMASLVNYANHIGSKDELAAFVASLPNAEEMTKSNDEIYNSVAKNATKDDGKNKASIKSSGAPSDPMKSVKEDLGLLFGDSSELSEDFRLRTEALFEAAVTTRVAMEVATLEEKYEAQLDESIEAVKSEMVENIDNYLNYAVAEWISENKVAIESNIRTSITESFMEGLKALYEDHYIEIPDDKVDVVEAMALRIEELENTVNDVTEKNIELGKVVNEKAVREVSDRISESLTDTQKDKFNKLVEAIHFSDVEEFEKKANIIKETYFSQKVQAKKEDQLLSETVEEPVVERTTMEPDMQLYVKSLSKTLKR